MVTTGISKDVQKLIAIWSASILLIEYGNCPERMAF